MIEYQSNLNLNIQQKPVIVIDNGSFECRAGWSYKNSSHFEQWQDLINNPFLNFRNQVAKPKTLVDKDIDQIHIVGNEFQLIEQSKLQKKFIFDRGIITKQSNLEHLYDHCFYNLGINEQIENPVILTEALCNPNKIRALTSELMFECYDVPSLCYTNDALCGYLYHSDLQCFDEQIQLNDALIINSGNFNTHIITILDGKMSLPHTKRIPIGGNHHTESIQKSLTLKYPLQKGLFTWENTLNIQHNHTYCASNYKDQIKHLEQIYDNERQEQLNQDQYRLEVWKGIYKIKELKKQIEDNKEQKIDNKKCENIIMNVSQDKKQKYIYKSRSDRLNQQNEDIHMDNEDHIIQRPWIPETQPSPEELKQRQEARKEQGRKLKELMQKKREEKEKKEAEELKDMEQIDNIRLSGKMDASTFKEELCHRGYKNQSEFQKRLELLRQKREQKKQKELDNDIMMQNDNQDQIPGQINDQIDSKYNLIDIDDQLLTPEQLKYKRIQKMQKTAAQLRDEKRKEVEDEKEFLLSMKQIQQDYQQMLKGEIKKDNFDFNLIKKVNNYLLNLYQQRLNIIQQMEDRKKQREKLSKRSAQLAHKRMQIIASLEKEDDDMKNGEDDAIAIDINKFDQNNDIFQQQNKINFNIAGKKGVIDEEWNVYKEIQKDRFSEDEEEDQQALQELEDQILELDNDFNLILFQNGPEGHRPSTAEDFQIRLWTDRYRGSEILYQPSIIGLKCAGLQEALEYVLQQMSSSQKQKVLQNVVVLGGNSLIPGFDQRLKIELQMLAPSDQNINIVNYWDQEQSKPQRSIEPWLGAAKLAGLWQNGQMDMDLFAFTKKEYQECGESYLREHFLSNIRYGF